MQESQVLQSIIFGNSLQNWISAGVIVLASLLLAKLFYWLSTRIIRKHVGRSRMKLDDLILDMVEGPVVFVVVLFGIWYSLRTLTLPENLQIWLSRVVEVLVILTVGWLLVRLFDAFFKEYVLKFAVSTETELDDQLLPIIRTVVKAIIWVVVIIVALENAGYDVGALLAGLGIGGLALAMAAKDTLANIFGGFTIFTDKPFRLNDRVVVGGHDGFVREVGLRSTRIETLAGRTITIPNSKFTETPVENISAEPDRKVVVKLGLTYETTPEQMELAMKLLLDLARKEPLVDDNADAGFWEFGDSSLNLLFVYHILKGSDILAATSRMNMAILRIFNENRLEFAFPTQVHYTKSIP